MWYFPQLCRNFPLIQQICSKSGSRHLLQTGFLCPAVVLTAGVHHHRERTNIYRFFGIIRANRNRPNKHWNPQWKRERGRKYYKVTLPDYDFVREKLKGATSVSPEIRAYFRKRGVPVENVQYRPWAEIPAFAKSSHGVFKMVKEAGAGKFSKLISPVKKRGKEMKQFLTNVTGGPRIKKLPGFEKEKFLEEAHQIYVDTHKALQDRDEERLHDLVTEYLFPTLWKELELRSVRWEMVKSIEPARIIEHTTQKIGELQFMQIIVRFHTEQKLAIFDQFGRLMLGSEDVGRSVVEHLVFEMRLEQIEEKWRLHAKIPPPGPEEVKTPIFQTFRKKPSKEEEEED